jgi:hypothetical protein
MEKEREYWDQKVGLLGRKRGRIMVGERIRVKEKED